jgi:competence protein ComEA
MRRSMRWIVVVIFVAGLLSGGMVVAQDKSGTPPGTSGMAPAKAAPTVDKMSTPAAKAAPAADKMSTAAGKAATVTGPVDLNTADEAALKALKGIGPVKAKAIVDYRQTNGPFKSVDDLKKVPGIGAKLLAQLKGKVTVGM